MKRLTVDAIQALLPEAEELRPLADRIIALSEPDDSRRWAASGELGTLGQRLVSLDALEREMEALVSRVEDHVHGSYRRILLSLRALERGEEAEAVDGLLELSSRESEVRRLKEADAYALAAWKIALKLGDPGRTVQTLLQGARIARARAHLDSARERYRQAFDLALAADQAEGAVTAAVGSGNVLVDRGLWVEAEAWYRRAMIVMEKSGYSGPQSWHTCLNLSIVRRRKGELDSSDEWLRRAERAHLQHPEEEGPALLANARGQLLMARGEPELAEGHFRTAVEAAAAPEARVVTRVNLGECLLALGRVLEAGEEGRRAEHEALVRSVFSRLPEVYRLLGRVAGARNIEDGFVFFEKAMDVVRERSLPRFELAQSLEAYGEFELERGLLEPGVERLQAAASIYEELGSHALTEAVRAKIPSENGDT
jgi:tetratricopeptide (TPR) repeat protein